MRRTIFALLTALLIAAPSLVSAQAPIGVKVFDPTCNCWRNLSGTSDGSANVQVVNPDAYLLYKYTNAISNRLTFGNMDSSVVYPFAGTNRLIAYLTVTMDSTTCSSLWALQVRRHLDTFADSISAWPARQTGRPASASASISLVQSGAADTIGSVMPVTFGTSSAPLRGVVTDEFLIAVPNNLTVPRKTFSLELIDRSTGKSLASPYMSFRLHPVAIYGDSTNSTCSFRALKSATARLDLTGER